MDRTRMITLTDFYPGVLRRTVARDFFYVDRFINCITYDPPGPTSTENTQGVIETRVYNRVRIYYTHSIHSSTLT